MQLALRIESLSGRRDAIGRNTYFEAAFQEALQCPSQTNSDKLDAQLIAKSPYGASQTWFSQSGP